MLSLVLLFLWARRLRDRAGVERRRGGGRRRAAGAAGGGRDRQAARAPPPALHAARVARRGPGNLTNERTNGI